MKGFFGILVMVMILMTGFGSAALAGDGTAREGLLFEEIPVVFSSSKRFQPITEAASSIVIITAEDIRLSGATSLGDVLRTVAGVDVRESDVAQHVIGVRGFCDTGHLLVTLDGNSVFMYHANHIFLDWAPFGLEEIDHIEIIKGPGAIFYGGNAFSGVVNIVTKTPREAEGGHLNAFGGTWNTIRGNAGYAGRAGKLDYYASAGHRRAKEWDEPNPNVPEGDHFTVTYGGGKAVYHFDAKSAFSLMARYSDARSVISRVCNPKTLFAALRYDRPDFRVRLFNNRHVKDFWDGNFGVQDNNTELEVFRAFRWGRNMTSVGAYVKHTYWAVEKLKEPDVGKSEAHRVYDAALNAEQEFRLGGPFILTIGGRGEYYSMLNLLGSGRASIMYKPADGHGIRLTAANGYYIPSLFQHTNEGTVYPFALGNKNLKQENITSFELSYFAQLTNRVRFEAAVFYNLYSDLIDNTQSGPMQNIGGANQYGGEADVHVVITNWLTGFANYAYQTINRDDFGNLAVDPEHKANFGLRATPGRFSASGAVRYVSQYNEIYLTSNPVFGRVQDTLGNPVPSLVESYAAVDARVGYRLLDNLELSLAGYNLIGNGHYESNPPDGNPGNWHTGDLVGRRFTAGANWSF